MAYDPEKYREKREKVLGIRKRGIGFAAMAAIVSAVIVTGLSVVTVPQAVSYMTSRHLDDAIFKLESENNWPETVLSGLAELDGVKAVAKDKHSVRLVVTYDRRKIKLSNIAAQFGSRDLDVTVLNQVSHLQHQATLKSEEEELETP